MVSNNRAIAQCERDLQYPTQAILEATADRSCASNSEEFSDVLQFTSQYTKPVTYEQYNEVAFMYACFNLLYLGDDNF